MWGNLAGRISQNLKENASSVRTPGKLIARLGEVVAPTLEDSDDEYEDDEEEYEEYEDEYEVEGEYDEEEEEIVEMEDDGHGGESLYKQKDSEAGGRGGGFDFAAMLGSAIDNDEYQHEWKDRQTTKQHGGMKEEEEEEEEEDDGEDSSEIIEVVHDLDDEDDHQYNQVERETNSLPSATRTSKKEASWDNNLVASLNQPHRPLFQDEDDEYNTAEQVSHSAEKGTNSMKYELPSAAIEYAARYIAGNSDEQHQQQLMKTHVTTTTEAGNDKNDTSEGQPSYFRQPPPIAFQLQSSNDQKVENHQEEARMDPLLDHTKKKEEEDSSETLLNIRNSSAWDSGYSVDNAQENTPSMEEIHLEHYDQNQKNRSVMESGSEEESTEEEEEGDTIDDSLANDELADRAKQGVGETKANIPTQPVVQTRGTRNENDTKGAQDEENEEKGDRVTAYDLADDEMADRMKDVSLSDDHNPGNDRDDYSAQTPPGITANSTDVGRTDDNDITTGSMMISYTTDKVEKASSSSSSSSSPLDLPRPIVFCGPSGVGKGTLIDMLLNHFPNDQFGFSVSHTTRKPRHGEVDGVHYNFTPVIQMKKEIDEGKFIEYAQMHGNYYGTSIEAVRSVQSAGKVCILDIDVQGVRNVKKSSLTPYYVFIAPPSMEELESRLRGRGTESEEDIERRLRNAAEELEYGEGKGNFDRVFVNDNLTLTFKRMVDVFKEWYPHLVEVKPYLDKPKSVPSEKDTGEIRAFTTPPAMKSLEADLKAETQLKWPDVGEDITAELPVPSSDDIEKDDPKRNQVLNSSESAVATFDQSLPGNEDQWRKKTEELEALCQKLTAQLSQREQTILMLQREASERDEKERIRRELEERRRKDEEEQLLAAASASASQERERELLELRRTMESRCTHLEEQLKEERMAASQVQEKMRRLFEEASARADAAEAEMQAELSRQQAAAAQTQQRQKVAVQMSEEKLARAMAMIDEKEGEIHQLQNVISDMRKMMARNMEGVEHAEQEIDDLRTENENLLKQLKALEQERSKMAKKMVRLEDDHSKLGGLQMELQMLKEARDRDRAQIQSATESATENTAKLAAERDAALAEARDLERQLAAALADLDLVRADYTRAITASSNLQKALEAFQSEREAETALYEEQRQAAEEAMTAAHAAALEAAKEANEARMREVQNAADAAVRTVMEEVNSLEQSIEQYRKENLNLRRSLDEAIHRLQTSQEDVIDRSLMKNILLDWHSKTGKARRDVMIVMSSVLHFTEEEKDKVGIGQSHGGFGKVVGAVAAPLPPSTLNLDKIEGDGLRDKFVSFLLAESGADEDSGIAKGGNNADAGSAKGNGVAR